jgi:hypothetical protein
MTERGQVRCLPGSGLSGHSNVGAAAWVTPAIIGQFANRRTIAVHLAVSGHRGHLLRDTAGLLEIRHCRKCS